MTPEAMRKALEDVRLAREAELKSKYDRSLPFADGLFDRWERARRLGFAREAGLLLGLGLTAGHLHGSTAVEFTHDRALVLRFRSKR